jgi:hypothetical protein
MPNMDEQAIAQFLERLKEYVENHGAISNAVNKKLGY